MTSGQQLYVIFVEMAAKDGWPQWEGLDEAYRGLFERMSEQSAATPERLEEGTYQHAKASQWVEDCVGADDHPVLKVRFAVPLAKGLGYVPWTCWLDNLLNDEGKPSPSLKGLLAMGVTKADVEAWLTGQGGLLGLNRNEVEIVTEKDQKGYLQVKWVNSGPRDLVSKKPLDRASQAEVGKRMLAALARIGPATAATASQPSLQAPLTPQEGKVCAEHGEFNCRVCPPF